MLRSSDDVNADYPPEQWHIEAGGTPEDGRGKIQAEAFRRGLVRERQIGSARCLLLKTAEVTTIYEEALARIPTACSVSDPGLVPPTSADGHQTPGTRRYLVLRAYSA